MHLLKWILKFKINWRKFRKINLTISTFFKNTKTLTRSSISELILSLTICLSNLSQNQTWAFSKSMQSYSKKYKVVQQWLMMTTSENIKNFWICTTVSSTKPHNTPTNMKVSDSLSKTNITQNFQQTLWGRIFENQTSQKLTHKFQMTNGRKSCRISTTIQSTTLRILLSDNSSTKDYKREQCEAGLINMKRLFNN